MNMLDKMGDHVTACWIDRMVVLRVGLRASEMDVKTVIWTTG